LTNLKLMRQFYVLYAQQIGQTASGLFQILQLESHANRPFNLSWSHYVFCWESKNRMSAVSMRSTPSAKNGRMGGAGSR
jgi:hypothetical protein